MGDDFKVADFLNFISILFASCTGGCIGESNDGDMNGLTASSKSRSGRGRVPRSGLTTMRLSSTGKDISFVLLVIK